MTFAEASPLDSLTTRKARGAFFTPPAVCEFIVNWAIQSPNDAVLEPSCGQAAFLNAAAHQLLELGGEREKLSLTGVEIHGPTALIAAETLKAQGFQPAISTQDFLTSHPRQQFDVVVGNPPFIRFQDFSGKARATARHAALKQGVRLSNMASSWAAFVIHSAAHVKPNGRLGFVLPAELLAANYAADVRQFLLRRFAKVELVLIKQAVFPGVLTEVVLLLCEGHGGTEHVKVSEVDSIDDLGSDGSTPRIFRPDSTTEKWTPVLANGSNGPSLLAELLENRVLEPLGGWGHVSLGAVTGANSFFTLSPEEARLRGIPKHELIPISPPGSRHLREFRFQKCDLNILSKSGRKTLLFRPGDQPSKAARRYISEGELAGVHHAYKCRVRSKWWQVSTVAIPDLLITCMNSDTPRLATNEAQVHHLNSVHGLYLREDLLDLAVALSISSLNSATMLGAELVGRSYGGGILKLEPREALRLPLPHPDDVQKLRAQLTSIFPRVRDSIVQGELLAAAAIVDELLLKDHLGLTDVEIQTLRQTRNDLADRRSARAASLS